MSGQSEKESSGSSAEMLFPITLVLPIQDRSCFSRASLVFMDFLEREVKEDVWLVYFTIDFSLLPHWFSPPFA